MKFAKYKVVNGAVTKDGHVMFLEDIVKELNRKSFLEEKFTSTNIPSAKCYSIDCPAIWYDKCTSSKFKDCCVREGE